MSRRITIIMTIAVLSGFMIIVLVNIASMVGFIPSKFISPNDVKGVAVEHNGELYTLNFSQQNQLIDVINRSFIVTQESVDRRTIHFAEAPEINKIIIYRFNEPNVQIEITPIAYVSKKANVLVHNPLDDVNIVFSAPLLSSSGLLEEANEDEIYKMLKTTYDP